MNFDDMNLRNLIVYALGIGAAFAVTLTLLVGVIDRGAGYLVPDHLTAEHTEYRDNPEAYTPPEDPQATCTLKSEVGKVTRDQIKDVIQSDKLPPCRVKTNALQWDTLWGVFGFALICAVGYGLWRIYESNQTIGLLVFVLSLIAAAVAGALLDDIFIGWLERMGVPWDYFWRGFIASLVLTVGGVIALVVPTRD